MLKADAELQRYVPLNDVVVFAFENRWYRLLPVRSAAAAATKP